MGNENRQQVFQPQLDFHSQSQHPIHGEVRVYFTKALPMTFIMKLQRSSSQSRLYNLYQRIQDQQSPTLLTLYGFKIQRQQTCGMCSVEDQTLEFWEYLNYTLQQHILDRAKRNNKFTYHEIWHVIQAVLETINLLARVGLIWQVHPMLLEITPEGRLKADWSHLQLDNKHLRFKQQMFQRPNQLGPWWSPQQTICLRERARNMSTSIDFQACNIYRLGLLLLSMMNLTVEPVINHRNWQEVLRYEQPLPQFVNMCLNPDPKKRPHAEYLYNKFEDNFNSAYELLISQGRRQDMYELQYRAQILTENKSSKHFSQLKEGSKFSDAFGPKASRMSQFPSRVEYKQSKVDTSHETYDQRLQALRQYRKSLALSRQHKK